ncbi:hypothetical protein GQ44DRAFT_826402 [Phaeosphaeriaceae sp. PMI808]|nr:hypothetical protein GQ44DRAFT_826402 [Phaeosphaeriaceae sp. PMI808]
MRFAFLLTATAFSSVVFAASTPPTPNTNEVASILEALRENNPEDAEAAASIMKIKLRRRDPIPQVATDLDSILAALEANSPADAAAAKQAGVSSHVQKRQEDLNSILAALEANNPEDAAAARQASGGRVQ